MAKKEDIAIIVPPTPFLFVKTHYPIGPAILASILKDAGHEVLGFDIQDVKASLLPKSDWYLFSSTTPSYPYALAIAKDIRSKYPHSRFVIGGPHSSALPDDVYKDDVWDYVVVGEADDEIVNIIGGHFKPGIIFCSLPENIDQIPLRNVFPKAILKLNNIPATNILLTRGCPYKCLFCASGGIKHRIRSNPSIECELINLRESGYSALVLNDDAPILNDEHLMKLCALISQFGMSFRMNLRADQVTKKRIRLLKQNGCVQINIGVESVNDPILKEISKRTSLRMIKESFEIIHNAGIETKALLIHGLPGTGIREAWELVDFVKQARPTYVTLTSFFPIPGSPYFNLMKSKIKAENLNIFDFLYHGKDGNSVNDIIHFPNGVLTSDELGNLKKEIMAALATIEHTKLDRGEFSQFDPEEVDSNVKPGERYAK